MRRYALLLALILIALPACGLHAAGDGYRTVIGWSFEKPGDLHGWQANGDITDARVADGMLSARCVNTDPLIVGPLFDIPATADQCVEIVIRSDRAGEAQLYWTNTLNSQYGGFLPEKVSYANVLGDNRWHTLRVFPFWQTEKKIIHLRFDPPTGARFAIKSIRVAEPANVTAPVRSSSWDFTRGLQGWSVRDDSPVRAVSGGAVSMTVTGKDSIFSAPRLDVSLADCMWVAVTMRAKKANRASLVWATDGAQGQQSLVFPVRNDGRFHTYNIDMGGAQNWIGKLLSLGLRPSFEKGDAVEIRDISLQKDAVGGPDLYLQSFGLDTPVSRVGMECPLAARFINYGAKSAVGVKAVVTAPPGVTVTPVKGETSPVFDPLIPSAFRYTIVAARPVDGEVTISISGGGVSPAVFRAPIHVTKSLGLERTRSIPAPAPAKTDYQLGMYYFPGWDVASKWECIERVAPWRKPVMGYYDEANPECADWQIKWAVEHGITFFAVDWYWCDGQKMLDHWVNNAYMKSKYRSYLKWAVMWANHNSPGTHSVADWRKVTQYWVDNYFGMKEYQRIDGMPAVYIWSTSNLRSDVGGTEKVRELLSMSQEMAKKAGYAGIKFVVLNISGNQAEAKMLASEGFTANTEYHWFADAPGAADDFYYVPYSLVVDRSKAAWEERAKSVEPAGLDFIPVADSGWDPQPWHGFKSTIIYGRNPVLWEKLLRQAKSFMDARGKKMLLLGPCNEWGEGSYLEPCTEFGFAMYDVVRRVFCDEPEAHTDIVPADVGLGPYDLPMIHAPRLTKWSFDRDGDTQGWFGSMGLINIEAKDGRLHAVTSNTDPAFGGPEVSIDSKKYSALVVRLKMTPAPPLEMHDQLQLFWGTSTQSMGEATSVRTDLICDGEFHDYVLPVAERPNWRGIIRSLRLDPGSRTGVDLWIDEIRFVERAP